MTNEIDRLIDWIRSAAAPADGLTVPVSGGSDGALALWLCARAYPGKTRALHLGDRLRARPWFESIAPLKVVPLPTVPVAPGDPEINAEAMRWAIVASHAVSNDWPVGTRNRTEEVLRTYSRASQIATFLPIVGVWKSDVMKLCSHIGVPAEILASSRKPDPICGRPRELADIGIEKIDAFLKAAIGEATPGSEELSEEERSYLERLYASTSFKASLPHRGPAI